MPDDQELAAELQGFGGLPIQPTGSGVKDLEIAYEQMKLAEEDAGDADPSSPAGMADGNADVAMPTQGGLDAADSAAHPS